MWGGRDSSTGRMIRLEGFVARMGDNEAPEDCSAGRKWRGRKILRGTMFDWLKRLQESLTAFSIANNKEGWEANAKRAEERGTTGSRWGWSGPWTSGTKGDAETACRLKRERDAAEEQVTLKGQGEQMARIHTGAQGGGNREGVPHDPRGAGNNPPTQRGVGVEKRWMAEVPEWYCCKTAWQKEQPKLRGGGAKKAVRH